MGIFQDRRPDSFSAEQSRETRERLVQLGRIAQRRLEKLELLPGRPGGLRFQFHPHDRMFRPEGFQMRLEQTEQDFDRAGRIGDVKAVLVVRLVAKS